MRILHLCPPFGRRLGAYRRIYALFHDDGHEHLLVSTRFRGGSSSKTQKFVEDMATNLRLVKGVLSLQSMLNRPPFRAFAQERRQMRFVLDVIGNQVYDLIYAHNLSWQVSVGARLASRWRVPFVVEPHGLYEDVSNKVPGTLSPRRFVRRWRTLRRHQIVRERADLVVCQTQRLIEYFKNLGISESRLVLIPNGVDFDEFDPKKWIETGKDMRAKMKLDNRIVFLYSGYLDEVNGIGFMLSSLEKGASLPGERATFLFIGDGPLKSEVVKAEERFGDLIRYVGTIDQKEMPFYYALSDVVVIPRPRTSGAENMTPLKLLEAMAMDKVILASEVGGITEAVHTGSAVLFEPGDRNDFLRKVSSLIQNREELHTKGTNRKIIAERYNWKLSRQVLEANFGSIMSL